MNEASDEQKIRELISRWLRATAEGDASQLHDLMAPDVVFLLPGQPPMCGQDAFATAFLTALEQWRMDGVADIQEIRIAGDLAFCWNHLTVTVTPLQGGSPQYRKGYILSVFRKEPDGRWVLFRDANLLTDAQVVIPSSPE